MEPTLPQEVALFRKCREYKRVDEVRAAGLYPYFRSISDCESTVAVIEGRECLMMGSNNYLGLTHHPEVIEAASRALRRYGSGCTGSRLLNGTLDLHGELEKRLARFVHKEAALVFSSGYLANAGLISGLVGRRDTVFVDKLDHASIIDGARLSFGRTRRFGHGNLEHLERELRRDSSHGRLVIVDGVNSMEGDIADVPGLVDLCRRYDAALALDDAHAIGVLGPGGEGTAADFGMSAEADLLVGTFSKSLASIGGFLAGDRSVIHYLKHHARPFIFTAALPPSNAAGVLASLEILRREPARRERLWRNTRRFQAGCRELGFNIGGSQVPIVPLLIGPVERTFRFWRGLFDAGVFTNPVIPPAVPAERCRIRVSLMATHTVEQIDACLETLARLGGEVGVI